MAYWVGGMYLLFLIVSSANLLLMGRPRKSANPDRIAVLIPARDEAENMVRLIPTLVDQFSSVTVFDDESTDGTGEIAESLGANVLRPSESLPKGWTGKNRACHELGTRSPDAEWIVFLDADVYPAPDFAPRLAGLLSTTRAKVVSGFPTIAPGEGIEPLFLAWVGWILLATNPYGIVTKTGKGHNRFTNGQFVAWRREVWLEMRPNEQVRHRVGEDVAIGRLLAAKGIPVEIANVSDILTVRMYRHWRETLDGMSKNSFEITGTAWGTLLVAGLMFFLAWGWLLWLPSLAILTACGVIVTLTARTAKWPALLLPVALSIGGYTMLRSLWWKRTGQTRWKGRTYV